MLLAVVIVVMVMGLGLAFMGESIFRSRAELTERQLDEGLRICDGAVEQARRFLFLYRSSGTWSWNEILQYNSSMPYNDPNAVMAIWEQRKASGRLIVNDMSEVIASTWPEAPLPANRTVPPTNGPSTVFGVFSDFGGGTWYMTVRNNSDDPGGLTDTDGFIMISVTAIMRDKTIRAIEARVKTQDPLYTPQAAIVTNGSMQIGGNLSVQTNPGTSAADVHSNGSITFNGGSASVQGNVSAFGSISGSPSGIRDGVTPNAGKMTLPIGDPAYYKPQADFILRSDGSVTSPSGTLISPAGASFYNFTHGAGGWSVSGDTPLPPSATYYIEGDLDMTGRGRFNATLIVTGSANIRGQGSGWTLGPAIGNVVMIAGGDFKMNGDSTLTGTVLANEQISMNGNATVDGSLIALDKSDTSSLVTTSSDFADQFGGSAVVKYSGGQSTLLAVERNSADLINTRRIR